MTKGEVRGRRGKKGVKRRKRCDTHRWKANFSKVCFTHQLEGIQINLILLQIRAELVCSTHPFTLSSSQVPGTGRGVLSDSAWSAHSPRYPGASQTRHFLSCDSLTSPCEAGRESGTQKHRAANQSSARRAWTSPCPQRLRERVTWLVVQWNRFLARFSFSRTSVTWTQYVKVIVHIKMDYSI